MRPLSFYLEAAPAVEDAYFSSSFQLVSGLKYTEWAENIANAWLPIQTYGDTSKGRN